MEARIKVQFDTWQRIQKLQANLKKSPKERLSNEAHITTRLKTLEEMWAQFSVTHTKIVAEAETEHKGNSYFSQDLYDVCQELYIQIKTDLTEYLDKTHIQKENIQDSSHDSSSTRKHTLKLPKITITSFTGKYTEWVTFRDLFSSLVHNNGQLDDVEKLHYLKGHLKGEAEQLLRHIPITNENYKLCWQTLQERYDNKRYLSNCILKTFFAQKNMSGESATTLRAMLDCTNETLHSLENLGVSVHAWDIMVIFILCQKLDPESRKQWEIKLSESANSLPSLTMFKEFLESRSRALEFLDTKVTSKIKSHIAQVSPSDNKLSCIYCKEDHRLYHCKGFSSENVESRRKFVQTNNVCFNCLGTGHSVYSCKHTTRCRTCRRKHHSLLHPQSVQSASVEVIPPSLAPAGTDSSTSPEVTTCFSSSNTQVLLATALINAKATSGKLVTLRCLLDQGSQASLITESAVQLLGIKKIPHQSSIIGIGSNQNDLLASKSRVDFNIQALHNPDVCFRIQALVLPKLTAFLPSKRATLDILSQFSDITLADPSFGTPNKIDLLLGADIYGHILLEGIIKGPPGLPVAQQTKLGWILSGPIDVPEEENPITCNWAQVSPDNELLKKFWEQEADIVPVHTPFTEEEERCEQIYTSTTCRDSSGRYIVNLPFKNQPPQCEDGNSKEIAIKRFLQQEKRLNKDSALKSQYSEVISEYIKLGHMEIVPQEEVNNPVAVYLPHHAVVRENRDTTKVRVVFDASAVNSKGTSLNDDLLVGPKLQDDLRHILMRWRRHSICLVSDIVKMYRQVKVAKPQTDYQRMVWRDNPEEELQHFRLLRVTFGTASAPYLAVRTLHQLAQDDGADYPTTAEKVKTQFYMDDYMGTMETVEEGKQIYEEMTKLLKGGGFELQKWTTNNEELSKLITEGEGEVEKEVKLKLDTYLKILGLTWNRNEDSFEFRVELPAMTEPVTKRKVISDISRLFDPLGWLSPVIIKAKIFIQRLWLSGIEWDEELPPQLLTDWINYRNNLTQLTNFRLPRWIHIKSNDELQELQGFCDASNDGFAAVVYLRVIDSQGEVHVSLITSKTKVSPIKQVSIPRLELCGAVLLTKLLVEVSDVLGICKSHIHAWTDSSIVLAWLNSRPNRWKTYVANRVTEIITAVEPHQWSHVISQDNPADCASRGTTQLNEQELWKEGPKWLKEKHINYKTTNKEDTHLEEKKVKQCFTNISSNTQAENPIDTLLSKCSSFTKLIRVIAYIKRWVRKAKGEEVKLWLETKDIQESLKTCIKISQEKAFFEELREIKEKRVINKKKSKLTTLNPFLDEDGLLRVGGRLHHAEMSEDQKHPVILPHKSDFTKLVVADAHFKTIHGGPQLMLNNLRTKYWIIGAKQLVRAVLRKCIQCLRHSAKARHQIMGQLPSVRAAVARPFINSGADYAGPIQMRTSKGRGHHSFKGYICLFVCMSTRAIHLEAVSDLSTQGFLAAFKRFVARRGACVNLWSDNGTNFVGSARELKALFTEEKSSMATEIAEQLATNGTTWHFIPPHAPNFGGLWEAGIKSTKHHLKRIIGTSTLTFEEMSTVLTQIEACLNSRPLSKLSDDSGDLAPLTPGHFLIGEPLIVAPDYNYETSNCSSLRRWQLTQKMVQNFWKRWSREYLTQFYHRYKWTNLTPEPQIGDVVLVMEDNLPPAKWLYGLVTEKHTGLDKLTRVVSLKCKGNIIKRPVSKLCFLPVSPD